MRATNAEFHYRFWIICGTYFLGFACYNFDRVNVMEALARWVFRAGDPGLHSLAARHFFRAVFTISALLVAASAWVRTWGGAYLRSEVVHDTAVHSERLVADGPYRYVRNPLYFGSMLLATGMAFMASRAGAVILIVGNLLIVLRLIGREEAALSAAQGENYGAYVKAVPRLWPAFRPRLPLGSLGPRWPQAILGEGWIWIFAIDGFLFVFTLNSHLYVTLLWSVAGTYLLVWNLFLRSRPLRDPSD
jgi:hypothetical protein